MVHKRPSGYHADTVNKTVTILTQREKQLLHTHTSIYQHTLKEEQTEKNKQITYTQKKQ